MSGSTRPGGSVAVEGATVTPIAASETAVTLFESNPAVRFRFVYNDSSASLYLKYGAAASSVSFTVKIGAAGFFEFPTGPIYTGVVTGAWSSASGAARCTEG